jgi:hypothetical protein
MVNVIFRLARPTSLAHTWNSGVGLILPTSTESEKREEVQSQRSGLGELGRSKVPICFEVKSKKEKERNRTERNEGRRCSGKAGERT